MIQDINMEDEILIDAVTSKRAVLFLGSGALATSQLKDGSFSPLGSDLAKIVFENFFPDEEYEWESLQQVSSSVQAIHGKRELHNFLNSLFTGIRPSNGIKKLTEFPWSRIYTTNVDTAIERAYENSFKRAKDLTTVVGPKDKASNDPETELTLYKLHGCINRPDVDLVFSLEEYAEYKEAHLKLFNQLSIDLVDRPVIFIGYSTVDSNFQQVFKTIQKYCSTSQSKNKYFFIGPRIKSSMSAYLKSNGFLHYNMGIDDFAEHLSILTSGKRTTLRDYFIEKTLDCEIFHKSKLEPKIS